MESARSVRKIVQSILIFSVSITIVCIVCVVYSEIYKYKEVLDKPTYSEYSGQESIVNVKSTEIPGRTYLYEILGVKLFTPASRDSDLSSLVEESSVSDNENTVSSSNYNVTESRFLDTSIDTTTKKTLAVSLNAHKQTSVSSFEETNEITQNNNELISFNNYNVTEPRFLDISIDTTTEISATHKPTSVSNFEGTTEITQNKSITERSSALLDSTKTLQSTVQFTSGAGNINKQSSVLDDVKNINTTGSIIITDSGLRNENLTGIKTNQTTSRSTFMSKDAIKHVTSRVTDSLGYDTTQTPPPPITTTITTKTTGIPVYMKYREETVNFSAIGKHKNMTRRRFKHNLFDSGYYKDEIKLKEVFGSVSHLLKRTITIKRVMFPRRLKGILKVHVGYSGKWINNLLTFNISNNSQRYKTTEYREWVWEKSKLKSTFVVEDNFDQLKTLNFSIDLVTGNNTEETNESDKWEIKILITCYKKIIS